MPAPANPPFQAGALTTPRQLQRWLDVNKVNKLTRTQSYFNLPVFSVDNVWRGYSEIVGAFDYVATNNFALLLDYTAPTNPNYVACIMWVDEDLVTHRYSLWRGVGEVFYFDAPLYTGELIRRNFRIEIWNVAPTGLLTFNLLGAGTSDINGEYTYTTSTRWDHVSSGAYTTYHAGTDRWRFFNFGNQLCYSVAAADFQFGIYTTELFGSNPAPYGNIDTTASQAAALSFYTSVNGEYDYMWQTDFVLASVSTIVTAFTVVLNGSSEFDLPIVFPADSVPSTN